MLQTLQERTRAVLREVLAGTDPDAGAALLDYPRHENAGDSLIWLGEVAYLRSVGVRVRYGADLGRFDARALERIAPGVPLLFHGGGNLGDLWPGFQEFREHVVAANHHRRVVVLAQSMHFQDRANAERAARVFGAHPDLTILLREPASMERAGRVFTSTRLVHCPDMALGVGTLTRPRAADLDVVALVRDDRESAGGLTPVRARAGLVTDWHVEGRDVLRWGMAKAPGVAYRRVPLAMRRVLQPWMDRSYPGMAWVNVRAATATLSRGRVVVTDRLHAHVMCALLGIPHVVMDNAYGKVSAVFDDYTHAFGTAHLARDAQEALACVQRLQEMQQPA